MSATDTDIVDQVRERYRALRFMSYTGDQPDMDSDDIDGLADFLFDLGTEILVLRAKLATPRPGSEPPQTDSGGEG